MYGRSVNRDMPRITGAIVQVSDVAVEGDANQPVLLLKVAHPGAAQDRPGQTTIVLSPPGAAQLARILQEAVEKVVIRALGQLSESLLLEFRDG